MKGTAAFGVHRSSRAEADLFLQVFEGIGFSVVKIGTGKNGDLRLPARLLLVKVCHEPGAGSR